MTKIKACILDLDGVIVDTAKYHYLAWKRLAGELGFDFTEEQNERLKGVSRMASLEILLEVGGISMDDETKLKLADKKNTWYVEYISKMTPAEILTGAKEFMNAVKENGLKIAVGSASKNTFRILERINMQDYFDSVVDGNKVQKAKPDPEVFLKAAEELKVKPEECIVFEDAAAGIEAAINGNMRSVGVGSEKILSKADIVIANFENFTFEDLKNTFELDLK
jgi:beta-phosphoglucomutase